ncbi:hypothetical protein J2782_004497 [Brucella pseudogrignonensis]|uniref:Uncharacterized protein n=1 Tax=Brucella pseudogrignonensis TaxID=419475 RepID=A0ABU1MFA9_9HYPH|nr:hypothetical protein [Brucella pseudogrignonensis]
MDRLESVFSSSVTDRFLQNMIMTSYILSLYHGIIYARRKAAYRDDRVSWPLITLGLLAFSHNCHRSVETNRTILHATRAGIAPAFALGVVSRPAHRAA